MNVDAKEYAAQLNAEQTSYIENEVITDKLLEFLKSNNSII